MAKVFVATVMIAFEADTVSEACDSVSAMLTENLQQSGVIIDWQYMPHNCIYPDPVFIGEKNISSLEEGEIFNNVVKENING